MRTRQGAAFGRKRVQPTRAPIQGIHSGSKRRPGDGPRAGYDDKRYKQMREVLKATGNNVCWICRTAIDIQLKHPHPLSWSADHVVPRSQMQPHDPRHWMLSNAREAHLRCNESRGDRPMPSTTPLDTTRPW